MKKTIIIAAVVGLSIVGVSALAVSRVQAATETSPFTTLVEKIATKFGLNKYDVQKVFDEDKLDRQKEIEAKFQKRLTQFVTDGKITQTQKQLIIAKHKELQASREARRTEGQNQTPDERRAAMEAEKQALATWAKSNGIDIQYLFGGFGKRVGGHMGFGKPL